MRCFPSWCPFKNWALKLGFPTLALPLSSLFLSPLLPLPPIAHLRCSQPSTWSVYYDCKKKQANSYYGSKWGTAGLLAESVSTATGSTLGSPPSIIPQDLPGGSGKIRGFMNLFSKIHGNWHEHRWFGSFIYCVPLLMANSWICPAQQSRGGNVDLDRLTAASLSFLWGMGYPQVSRAVSVWLWLFQPKPCFCLFCLGAFVAQGTCT
jgi:hypothetical protein